MYLDIKAFDTQWLNHPPLRWGWCILCSGNWAYLSLIDPPPWIIMTPLLHCYSNGKIKAFPMFLNTVSEYFIHAVWWVLIPSLLMITHILHVLTEVCFFFPPPYWLERFLKYTCPLLLSYSAIFLTSLCLFSPSSLSWLWHVGFYQLLEPN